MASEGTNTDPLVVLHRCFVDVEATRFCDSLPKEMPKDERDYAMRCWRREHGIPTASEEEVFEAQLIIERLRQEPLP